MSNINLLHLKENKLQPIKTKFNVFYDDTIIQIKQKIILDQSNDIRPEEIYLFSEKKMKLNLQKIFSQNNANKGKFTLSKSDFNVIQSNLGKKINVIDKDRYFFNHLKKYNNINVLNSISIGHHLFDKDFYNFIINPYKVTKIDQNIYSQNNNPNIIVRENNKLLFEYGKLIDDKLYVCYAKDIWDEITKNENIKNKVDLYKYILQVYFPNLFYNEKIDNYDSLIDSTKKISDNKLKKINNSFKNLENFQKYHSSNKGKINSINFTIHPINNIKIPTDLLFKIINSNLKMPMVKYNPGKGKENIFRLFTKNFINENNLKLPYLYVNNNSKSYKIKNIDKILSLRESVGYYIVLDSKKNTEMYCEFYKNGSINIRLVNCLINKDEVESIIRGSLNKNLIDPINNFIKKSGFSYTLFDKLTDSNIETKDIQYSFKINKLISDEFSLGKYAKALNNIFVTNKKKFKTKNEIDFRYIRVSSYKEMQEIKMFIYNYNKIESITEIVEKNDNELIQLLQENFPKTITNKEKAVDEIKQYQEELTLNKSVYSTKIIEVNNNPGFYVKITKDFNKTFIKYENINNFNYLQFIDIYTSYLIDNFLLRTKKEIKRLIKNNFFVAPKPKPIVEKQNIKVVQAIVNESEEKQILDSGFKEDLNNIIEENEEKNDVNEQEDVDVPNEGFDSEEEEDDDDDDDDDDDWSGGGSSDESSDESSDDEEATANLNNISLKGVNNYFIKKIKKYDPKIIELEGDKSISFAKSCQTNAGKTPVLITDKEKKDIDKIDKEQGYRSYDEYITNDDGNHYICPRFWCLSDSKAPQGRSLSFQQINDGECGGWDALIPKNSKKASKNKRIFEFTDAKSHQGEKNNHLVYKQHYPGWQNKSIQTKDGEKSICLPCCYNRPTNKYEALDWEKDSKNQYTEPLSFQRKNGVGELPNPKKLMKERRDGSKYLHYSIPSIEKEYFRKRLKKSTARQEKKMLCQSNDELASSDNTRNIVNKEKTKERVVMPVIESFPLKKDNLGYLPLSVQKFFNYNIIKECWISSKNSRLIPNKWCLLRLGTDGHSLISAIRNVQRYFEKVSDFKKGEVIKITGKLTEDDNTDGKTNIVEHFGFDRYDIKIEEYEKNYKPTQQHIKLFKSLNKGNLIKMFSEKKQYTTENDRIRNSIINFVKFILYSKNKVKNIEEILWDLITLPKKLGGCCFEEGINLIIIKKAKDDIEDKIKVVCPKNNFSNYVFNKNKKTVILYSENDYYEPIYLIKRRKGITDWFIKRVFTQDDFKSKDLERSGFYKTIKSLQRNFEERCGVKPSLKGYEFKENKTLNKLLDVDKKGEYKKSPTITINGEEWKVIEQLYNLDYQVISIGIEKNDIKFALPCAPSALFPNDYIPSRIYNESYKDYLLDKIETEKYLKEFNLYNENLRFLISDNKIVGLRTNTNQAVLIIPENIDDEMDEINKELYELELDRKILLQYPSIDDERDLTIKKIKLESNFYLMFRNLYKIMINKKENEITKNSLKKKLDDFYISYQKKLKSCIGYIKQLLAPLIDWTEIDANIEIDDLMNCLDLNKTDCENNSLCSITNDTCKMIFPRKNLLYDDDKHLNKDLYYKKLADELIRYNKIREYVLNNDTFLNFEKIDYKINDDEIVIISSMFTEIYKNDIESIEKSNYINNYSLYDNTNIKDENRKKYRLIGTISEIDDESESDEEIINDEEKNEETKINIIKMKKPKKKQAIKPKKIKKEDNNKINGNKKQYGKPLVVYFLIKKFGNMSIEELFKFKILQDWLVERNKYSSGYSQGTQVWRVDKKLTNFGNNYESTEHEFNELKFNSNDLKSEPTSDIVNEFENTGVISQYTFTSTKKRDGIKWVLDDILKKLHKNIDKVDEDGNLLTIEKFIKQTKIYREIYNQIKGFL